MKAGWEIAELASLCTVFTDGNWIESKDQSTDGIRLVQTGNVGFGEFKDRRDKARFIDEETFERLKCFEVVPGDCLISRLPDPVGRACEIPETGDKMITAVDCSVVRADPRKLDRDFFIYYSQSRQYLRNVDKLCSGTTRRRISRKNLGKTAIPLPPLDEQKRIVAVLDAAFEGLTRARTHVETNLQNARELFEATVERFLHLDNEGWREFRFGELIDFLNGYAFKSSDAVEASNVQVLRMGNLYQNNLDLQRKPSFYPPSFADQHRKFEISKGDIVMSLTGTVGKEDYGFAVEIPDVDHTLLLNQRIAKLIFLSPDYLRKDFLLFLLRSKKFLKELYASANGTRQANLSTAEIKEFIVSIPPFKQQTSICHELTTLRGNLEEAAEAYRAKLQDLDELRQSLLQKAFAGELT